MQQGCSDQDYKQGTAWINVRAEGLQIDEIQSKIRSLVDKYCSGPVAGLDELKSALFI